MNLSEYLKKQGHGSVSLLATKIKGHPSDVSDWATFKRSVPPIRAVEIERATDGAVTRKTLRPNDWQKIWPELGD